MARARPTLLVDLSNTFTKVASWDGARLGRVQRFPTASWTASSLRAVLTDAQPRLVVVASVVPRVTRLIEKLRFPTHFVTARSPLGIAVDYPKPDTIGADRLANAAAAAQMLGAPSVVVDFGTAVTFDILDARAAYVGGIIAPGLMAMTRFLHENTALLPEITLAEPRRAVGRSTVEAMRIGAVWGYRAMIRGLLERVRAEVAVESSGWRVGATGGDAALVSRDLPEIEVCDPRLTLKGLGLIANRL